jgi:hypothetical protein
MDDRLVAGGNVLECDLPQKAFRYFSPCAFPARSAQIKIVNTSVKSHVYARDADTAGKLFILDFLILIGRIAICQFPHTTRITLVFNI